MKKILCIITMAMAVALAACSASKMTPEQKRAKEFRDSVAHELALDLLESQKYMITADRLTFPGGKMLHVFPSTNFLYVQGDTAIYQIAPGMGGGWNGVGGVTVKGRVSNYRSRITDKGEAIITFGLIDGGVSVDVSVNLPKEGTTATVRAQASLAKYNSTIYGNVEPANPMDITIGLSLF
ncbi:MAG: DUF4251 domain-containing protein [Clostridium sp.]|nr:DUF4251 domain-containing protein [Clostridium sp.]